jgi:hypothetical protein
LFLPCKVKDFLENNKHFSKKNKKTASSLRKLACDYHRLSEQKLDALTLPSGVDVDADLRLLRSAFFSAPHILLYNK